MKEIMRHMVMTYSRIRRTLCRLVRLRRNNLTLKGLKHLCLTVLRHPLTFSVFRIRKRVHDFQVVLLSFFDYMNSEHLSNLFHWMWISIWVPCFWNDVRDQFEVTNSSQSFLETQVTIEVSSMYSLLPVQHEGQRLVRITFSVLLIVPTIHSRYSLPSLVWSVHLTIFSFIIRLLAIFCWLNIHSDHKHYRLVWTSYGKCKKMQTQKKLYCFFPWIS